MSTGAKEAGCPRRSGDAKERQDALGVAILCNVYAESAAARMLEAEELLCRAMELREEAKALFSRAERLAMGHAAKYPIVQMLPQDDGIDW